MFKVHYSTFGLYRLQFFYIDVFLFKLKILIQWQIGHTKTCQCTTHFAKNFSVTQKVIHLTLQPPCHLLSSHVKHGNLVVISQMIKVDKCMVGWITFGVTWVVFFVVNVITIVTFYCIF
jgi:hypothetical protein